MDLHDYVFHVWPTIYSSICRKVEGFATIYVGTFAPISTRPLSAYLGAVVLSGLEYN